MIIAIHFQRVVKECEVALPSFYRFPQRKDISSAYRGIVKFCLTHVCISEISNSSYCSDRFTQVCIFTNIFRFAQSIRRNIFFTNRTVICKNVYVFGRWSKT